MFCLEMMSERQAKPTSRKLVKISKKYMRKQFSEVYAKAIIHLSIGE